MKIGSEEDFLRIEKGDPSDPYSAFVYEARTTADGIEFHGLNDSVHFGISDELKVGFAEFEGWTSRDLSIDMTEGCRMRLVRDPHGHIDVHYRISAWRLNKKTSLDGVFHVHGEDSQRFIKDLASLIFNPWGRKLSGGRADLRLPWYDRLWMRMSRIM